ncbi:MAG TPA: HD domain-containing phosphohydrolase [Thermoleophilaceae bacterium]|nr:HD domain-containing phosphohydrolase [Thermoleophilaceae bacterium]
MPKPLGKEAWGTVEEVLETVREMLEMDIAYLSEFEDGVQCVRDVNGDADSFGLTRGTEIPLTDSYCQRMLDGVIPNAIGDAHSVPAVSDLEVTESAGIAAYVGVPVVLSDGTLYGTLCCADHDEKSLGGREVQFVRLLAKLAARAVEREDEAVRRSEARAHSAALAALLASLDARDAYSAGHSASVVALATECATRLGCSESEVADLRSVALLHDIGKVGIPDSILRKPGALTAAEWEVMRAHPEIGARIVGSVDSLRRLVPAVRAEHERFDGTGYPDGLAGTDIPLASRIVLVCDAYHAMVSDRPYRKALPWEVACRELEDNAGTQFDPRVVAALLSVLDGGRNPGRRKAPGSKAGRLVASQRPANRSSASAAVSPPSRPSAQSARPRARRE